MTFQSSNALVATRLCEGGGGGRGGDLLQYGPGIRFIFLRHRHADVCVGS